MLRHVSEHITHGTSAHYIPTPACLCTDASASYTIGTCPVRGGWNFDVPVGWLQSSTWHKQWRESLLEESLYIRARSDYRACCFYATDFKDALVHISDYIPFLLVTLWSLLKPLCASVNIDSGCLSVLIDNQPIQTDLAVNHFAALLLSSLWDQRTIETNADTVQLHT